MSEAVRIVIQGICFDYPRLVFHQTPLVLYKYRLIHCHYTHIHARHKDTVIEFIKMILFAVLILYILQLLFTLGGSHSFREKIIVT